MLLRNNISIRASTNNKEGDMLFKRPLRSDFTLLRWFSRGPQCGVSSHYWIYLLGLLNEIII